jgi:hypothetical protein
VTSRFLQKAGKPFKAFIWSGDYLLVVHLKKGRCHPCWLKEKLFAGKKRFFYRIALKVANSDVVFPILELENASSSYYTLYLSSLLFLFILFLLPRHSRLGLCITILSDLWAYDIRFRGGIPFFTIRSGDIRRVSKESSGLECPVRVMASYGSSKEYSPVTELIC